MFKKLFSMVLVLILVIGMGANAFATQNNDYYLLKEEFESRILNQMLSAETDELSELTHEYNKYINLSKEDKYKFINYINDEEFMLKALNSSANITLEASDTNRNKVQTTEIAPDFLVHQTIKDEVVDSVGLSNSTMARTERRTATYSEYCTLFGIKTWENKMSVTYTRTGYGGKILNTLSSDNRTTRNFTGTRVTFSNDQHYVSNSGNAAYGTANFAFSFIFKGAWTYADGDCGVTVDNRGNVTGWLDATAF